MSFFQSTIAGSGVPLSKKPDSGHRFVGACVSWDGFDYNLRLQLALKCAYT
jgi:hypothetical protein